ncbi:MAG: prepilin peptidase [Candidatus Niyogibacteria bacterium]|nr:prepilin peptidase [Candidatus Niyogibacteria bacterium]
MLVFLDKQYWYYKLMLTSIFFIFGTIIGSFLNVVVLRLGTGESIISGRSRCYSCGTELRWYELIPLFSFLAQGGRCRTCRSRISAQYALVEFLTGAVFAAVLAQSSLDLTDLFGAVKAVAELTFWAAFIALVAYDVRHKILPDSLSAIIALSALAYRFSVGDFRPALLLAIGIAGLFALMWLVSGGRWMGLGDAKLFFGTSMFLGSPLAIMAALFSFWSGALVGLALMALGRLNIALGRGVGMKTELPFAPYIFFGVFVARFWGERILAWYLTLI